MPKSYAHGQNEAEATVTPLALAPVGGCYGDRGLLSAWKVLVGDAANLSTITRDCAAERKGSMPTQPVRGVSAQYTSRQMPDRTPAASGVVSIADVSEVIR